MLLLRRIALLLIAVIALPAGAAGQGASGDKLVLVVRHAEKANATDPDPSLSEAGRARAVALAAALRDAGVSDVLVTPRKRTHETAAVLVEARHLTAHVVPFGASTPQHAAAVALAVRKARGSAVLVVGHSNTVTHIIAALGGPRLPELCDGEYANLFIMRLSTRGTPSFVRAKFGASDAAAGGCTAATMK